MPQEDLSLGLDWPALHNELSTDLGAAFGNMGTKNATGDPWGGRSIGGGNGNATGFDRVNFMGNGTPLDFLANVQGGSPWDRLPKSLLYLDKTQEQVNAIQNGKDPQAATLPATNGNYIASAADNAGITADRVEQFIREKGAGKSPLAGKGQYIIDAANRAGVSVPQMLGIMLKESQLGVTADPNQKNITGIVAPTDGGLGTQRQFNGYATWEQSIDATANNLATATYKGKPIAEQIGNWYVGPQAYAANGLNATDLAGNGTVGDYVNKFIAPTYQYFNKPMGTPVVQAGQNNDLIAKAQTLVGTPYQLGGFRTHRNDPRQGIDCSEYTSWIYSGTGVNLPENAQMQYNATQRVDKSQLQPGDLVFFQGTYDVGNGDVITHVGMYIGNNQMINAQTGGVMVANLNDKYWQDHYAGAGRVTRTPAATNSTPR